MRILLYVMNFFIFGLENAYNGHGIFIPMTYIHHEKYPNLQASYIKDTYYNFNACWISGLFGETDLDKIKRHKYYEDKVIQLKVYEMYPGEKKNKILPTLLHLLDAIPENIVIKRGIINTEADSLVSGIDITETISARPSHSTTYGNIFTKVLCYSRDQYADLEFVVMDDTYNYGYYKCGDNLTKAGFRLSDEETEKKIIKKIDIPCTLRLNSKDIMNDFFVNLTPLTSTDEDKVMQKLFSTYVRFELRFSYICKFVSPLQISSNKNILQYKILNFTVNGYHHKGVLATPECLGLTYCLKHQNAEEYVSDLDEYFLYKIEV
ncbi:uncharacterized protein LOC142333180 isoform X2 [Lycorma delicatula]|uniref:uncharacterized protein LOC142333180 isoform X2 n=1 Tax=Lycorma delicatula TaxID=130591 RepID=UPI003F51386C